MRSRYVLSSLLATALVAAGSSHAAVLYVAQSAPGPVHDGSSWQTAFLTPGEALAGSSAEDEVWVKAGRYTGGFTLKSEVALYGGFAGTETQRDQRIPSQNASTLTYGMDLSIIVPPGAPPTTVLDGFTFEDVTASTAQTAIVCTNASPTLRNNTFDSNHYGSMAVCSGGAPVIVDNVFPPGQTPIILKNGCAALIAGNTFTDNWGSTYGGAIQCDRSPAVIRDNTFRGCSSVYGGAIYIIDTPGPQIANNGIESCQARYGGAIYSIRSNPVIANNRINHCSGSFFCGSVYVAGSATIVGNTVQGSRAPAGGSVYLSSLAQSPMGQVQFANNIVAFGTEGIVNETLHPAEVSLRNNCVFGNHVADYIGIPDPTGTDGNIRLDPMFADVLRGDLHIQPDSPCRGAGDDASVVADASDVDGQPRVQGEHVDIGADESDGTPWPSAPRTVYVRTDGDDSRDGASWATARRTIQGGVAEALRRGGGDVWIAGGTYRESVALKGYVGLYGGFAGNEVSLGQRGDGTPTILESPDLFVSAVRTMPGTVVITLDRLTVRNSYGGLSFVKCAVSIVNCDVTGTTNGVPLFLNQATAVVKHSTFTDNALHQSGAVTASGSWLTMSNCIVARNQAGYGTNAKGGGLETSTSFVDIRDNRVEDHSMPNRGGGLYLWACQGAVSNNLIARNGVGGNRRGGGIMTASSDLLISGNVLVSNSAPDGAAIVLSENSRDRLVNNTIAGNAVDETMWPAGLSTAAILFSPDMTQRNSPTPPLLGNNIIAFNTGAGVRVINTSGLPDSVVAPVMRNNAVFGNGGGFIGMADPTDTEGNIAADPLFVNRDGGDLRLLPSSPCIDAGDDAFVLPGQKDIDGRGRILRDRVDIGAYEMAPQVPLTGIQEILRIAGGLASAPADPAPQTPLDLTEAVRRARQAAGL